MRHAVPLALMAAASLTVVVTLVIFRNVWLTFALYHIGFCLVLPLVDSVWLKRRSLKDHARYVGLTGPGTKSGVTAGLLCAAVMGGGTLLAFVVLGDLFLADNRVVAELARWGIRPDNALVMMIFMVALNGMAEELFWRGSMHRRLENLSNRRLAVGTTALFYASYHAVTIAALFQDAAVTLLFLLTVFAAGCFWGWLRERYGSVWPALLGHGGATAGYMIVYWTRFSGRG